jgi:hypothetical protein
MKKLNQQEKDAVGKLVWGVTDILIGLCRQIKNGPHGEGEQRIEKGIDEILQGIEELP